MARDQSKLHPRLQSKIKELITLCNKKGLKIGIGECVRTVEEQNALYAQGRTKPGNKVTNAPGTSYSSMHQWGVAFDFYRNDGKGSYLNSDGFFDRVGALGRSIGLEWGGSWKSPVDKPHFQLPDWGSTSSVLKRTYTTPDKFFKTWNNEQISKEPTISIEDYTRKFLIKDLQACFGLKVTGVANKALLEKTITITEKKNNKHPAVKYLQKYFIHLGFKSIGTIDGIAGKKFFDVLVEFKKRKKLPNSTRCMASRGAVWKILLGLAKK